MCCECCGVKQRKVWVFGSGTLLIVLSILTLIFWSDIAVDLVDSNLVIEEGTAAYTTWVHAPIPIYLKFYMFNWTNPQDFYNPKIKPHFEQLGPYTYLEEHFKENITFYPNRTVSYYQRRKWTFQPELSNGTEMDMITNVHPITATVVDEMRHMNSLIKRAVNFILKYEGGKLYVTKPVHEWTFDGFQDQLIDFLKSIKSSKINIPYKRFAYMAERNDSLTYDGLFTMQTGGGDLAGTGLLENWNGRGETGYYEKPCGIVNGTTGDVFPPYVQQSDELTVFVTDACRYLNLRWDSTTEVQGVQGYEFVGTNETLDSGENFPNQQCFCKGGPDACPRTGVVDCRKCRFNAPIYASFPHFYLADQSYLAAVDGLNPSKEQHEFRLVVEPRTGVPLKINGRIQMNMLVQPDDTIEVYRGVPSVLMPLFWFEQQAELDEKMAGQAKMALNLESYGISVGIALFSMGMVVVMGGAALTLTKRWKREPEEDEDMLTNEPLAS